MGVRDGIQVRDEIFAELVDCTPTAEATVTPPKPEAPDLDPTTAAAEATIEQTGAGPPPEE